MYSENSNTNTKLVDLVDVLMDIIENHLTESNCEHCLNLFRSVFEKKESEVSRPHFHNKVQEGLMLNG